MAIDENSGKSEKDRQTNKNPGKVKEKIRHVMFTLVYIYAEKWRGSTEYGVVMCVCAGIY